MAHNDVDADFLAGTELFSGTSPDEVQMMLGWLEHGPRTARVTRMEYEEALPPTGQGFHTN